MSIFRRKKDDNHGLDLLRSIPSIRRAVERNRTSQRLDAASQEKLGLFLQATELTKDEIKSFLKEASAQSVKDFITLLEDTGSKAQFKILETNPHDASLLSFREPGYPSGDARFLIIKRIGVGGHSNVLAAYDLKLGRLVALKEVPDVFTDKVEYLVSEASNMAKLRSDYILTVHDFRTVEVPGPFDQKMIVMIMEYMNPYKSYQLSEIQKSNNNVLPVRDIQLLVDCLTQALEPYHKEGIYHRDIKPDNIWRLENLYKLADFGIARDNTPRPRLAPNSVLGTPAYMSPEIATGKNLSQASEVHTVALNALYAMSGADFFQAGTAPEIMAKIVAFDPINDSRHAGEILDVITQYCKDHKSPTGKKLDPRAILPVFIQALAKRPDERQQSVREFANALYKAWS